MIHFSNDKQIGAKETALFFQSDGHRSHTVYANYGSRESICKWVGSGCGTDGGSWLRRKQPQLRRTPRTFVGVPSPNSLKR